MVTGDHYAANCPKQNKKEEQTRPITPYPGRNRSSSKERGGASQGGETYRMMQGSFGSKPWSRVGAAAAAGETSAKETEVSPAPPAAVAESAAADERKEAGTGDTAALLDDAEDEIEEK